MAQYPIKTNFTAGELSPRLNARVDFAKYANGCETLENILVYPQGGATARPGTHFVTPVKNSAATTNRLIPFEFSTTQAYVIEAGDLYFRFYRNNGQITSVKTITNAVNNGAGLIRITAVAHGFTTGNTVTVANVGGVPNATGTWIITVISVDTFDLIGSTMAGAYTTGGTATAIVEILSNMNVGDLPLLKWAQSADVLYLTHPDFPNSSLSRTSNTAWVYDFVDFIDGPYQDVNDTTTTLTPSAFGVGAATITASSIIGINHDTGFQTTDIGRFIRLLQGTTWGWCYITSWTSTTIVGVTIVKTLTSVAAKSVWRLGAWSDTTGYPAAITFFEDRIVFGGTYDEPQTVWLSKSGDYEDFSPTALDGTVADNNGITFTLASSQVNTIRWLSSGIGLIIGTAGAEFTMFGGNDSPLTPFNVTVRRQTVHGSAEASPVPIGPSTLFIQRAGRKIRNLQVNTTSGIFEAEDMSLLAEHITSPSITQMSYQQEPDSVLWAIRSDGVLLALTFYPTQQVLAFSRNTTDGTFESLATIPHPDGNKNQVWAIVKRTINAVTKRYVEYFDDTVYTDSTLTYSGAPVTSVSGLDHLEAKTVEIIGDGANYPSKVVTAGAVTLSGVAASSIQVGLPFIPKIITTRPEVAMPNGGTSQGRQKHWVEIFVRVLNTASITIEGDEVPARDSDDTMGDSVGNVTEDIRVTNSGWDRDGRLTIQRDRPGPWTVLGLFGSLDVGGRDYQ